MNYKEKIEETREFIWGRFKFLFDHTTEGDGEIEEYHCGGWRDEAMAEIEHKLTALYEQAQRDAVEGLKVRQISGFQRDELGRWYKRYPTGMVLVTDELLLDALNVRQENIDLINEYLNQTKEDSEIH